METRLNSVRMAVLTLIILFSLTSFTIAGAFDVKTRTELYPLHSFTKRSLLRVTPHDLFRPLRSRRSAEPVLFPARHVIDGEPMTEVDLADTVGSTFARASRNFMRFGRTAGYPALGSREEAICFPVDGGSSGAANAVGVDHKSDSDSNSVLAGAVVRRFMRFGKRFMRFGREQQERIASSAPRSNGKDDDATMVVCFGDRELSEDITKRFMRFGKRALSMMQPENDDDATAGQEVKRFMRFGRSPNDREMSLQSSSGAGTDALDSKQTETKLFTNNINHVK